MAKHHAFYDSWRWRQRTSPLIRQYNPICQRIFDDGTQCNKPCTVVHHLIAPDVDMRKAHAWDNLVAVCDTHHPGGQRGETMGYRYSATCGPLNQIYYHKGGLLPTWHREYQRPLTGDVSRLAGTETSSVGDERISKALAGCDIDSLLDGM